MVPLAVSLRLDIWPAPRHISKKGAVADAMHLALPLAPAQAHNRGGWTSQPAASSLRDVRGYINVLSCAASPLLRALAPEEPPRPGFRSHLIAIGPNWAPMSIRGRSQGFLKASARTTTPSEHVSSALQGITSLPAASRQQ